MSKPSSKEDTFTKQIIYYENRKFRNGVSYA